MWVFGGGVSFGVSFCFQVPGGGRSGPPDLREDLCQGGGQRGPPGSSGGATAAESAPPALSGFVYRKEHKMAAALMSTAWVILGFTLFRLRSIYHPVNIDSRVLQLPV